MWNKTLKCVCVCQQSDYGEFVCARIYSHDRGYNAWSSWDLSFLGQRWNVGDKKFASRLENCCKISIGIHLHLTFQPIDNHCNLQPFRQSSWNVWAPDTSQRPYRTIPVSLWVSHSRACLVPQEPPTRLFTFPINLLSLHSQPTSQQKCSPEKVSQVAITDGTSRPVQISWRTLMTPPSVLCG